MALIEPFISEIIMGALAIIGLITTYFSVKRKGYNERQAEELKEAYGSGQESKQDMEDIRSASDDQFIDSVRDSEG